VNEFGVFDENFYILLLNYQPRMAEILTAIRLILSQTLIRNIQCDIDFAFSWRLVLMLWNLWLFPVCFCFTKCVM